MTISSKILPYVLLLFTLAALTKARGNLELGSTIGGHLIYHEVHEKYAIPLVKRSERVIVKGVGREVIKAVVIHDLKGNGNSFISDGGIGLRYVNVNLQSKRGEGFKFLVEAYAI